MKNLFLLLLGAVCVFACDYSADISQRPISLLSPVDNTDLDTSLVHFVWQEVEDVNYYQLLVSKALESREEVLVLDTTLLSYSYFKFLEPGIYFAQIRAHNNVSTAASPYVSFVVNSPDSLRRFQNQAPNILSPAPSANYSEDERILVLWETDLIDNTSGQMEVLIVSPSLDDIRDIVFEREFHWSVDRIEDLRLDSGTYQLQLTPYRYVSGQRVYALSDTVRFTVGQ